MSSDNQRSVRSIIERIEREKRQAAGAATAGDGVGYAVRGLWSCYGDPGELSAAQAHRAMQLHLGCGVDACLVRRRARAALVAAGRMVLDPRAAKPAVVKRKSVFTVLRSALFGFDALFLGGRHALR
ncbi:hypothetical protein [Nocardia seriolae]|uniref:Uncharacterized protein n=1 Tax=Nocardia seriolae TaxID=37332 RepID=A0A0B8NAJ8_9NOCA|nr:hypothetical protein [Nocardia seriolae]APB00569.1 hypothetical protein NS506_06536 [Nocardia seriolae]MTJ61937.1 hypothetical protein [Nocardia seriolae]MTJ76164.1 hypothetical protein [Nocardia seriolae]MTJ90035.1 hypothetical protein [Nocardia seriolae]MTK34008.1 hypothetical protein [Nocardia seriolae]